MKNYTKIGQTRLNVSGTEKAICFRNVWIPRSQSIVKNVYKGAGVHMSEIWVKNWLAPKIIKKLEDKQTNKELNDVIESVKKISDFSKEYSNDEFSTRIMSKSLRSKIKTVWENFNCYMVNFEVN